MLIEAKRSLTEQYLLKLDRKYSGKKLYNYFEDSKIPNKAYTYCLIIFDGRIDDYERA